MRLLFMHSNILCVVAYGMIKKFLWYKLMQPALDSHNSHTWIMHKFVALQ